MNRHPQNVKKAFEVLTAWNRSLKGTEAPEILDTGDANPAALDSELHGVYTLGQMVNDGVATFTNFNSGPDVGLHNSMRAFPRYTINMAKLKLGAGL